MKVNNVPVEFSGEDTSLAEKNLMLLSGYDTTIDLVLKGPRSELFKLDKSKVRIVADTSSIQETGRKQTCRIRCTSRTTSSAAKFPWITPAPTALPLPWGRWTARPCPSARDIVGRTATGFTAGGADPGPGGAESCGASGTTC